MNLNGMEQEIDRIFRGYMKIKSFSGSEGEKEAVDYLLGILGEETYFKNHPQFLGRYFIPGDSLGRYAGYALVLPEEEKRHKPLSTVCLMHHCDVVTAEDYGELAQFAFDLEEIEKALKKVTDSSSHKELWEDLQSNEYFFGRGSCDMKAGGAVQTALLAAYSREKEKTGALLLLCVPDEENLSAGMIGAVSLLSSFKEQYQLDYKMMINSEPNLHVVSEGSIGKMMPFVYVQGVLSHVGNPFGGINPVGILSRIVDKTENSLLFCEKEGDELTPPPSWLFMKDRKDGYNVSIPKGACGCFNLLTFSSDPDYAMEKLRKICEDSFREALMERRLSFEQYKAMGGEGDLHDWDVQVLDFWQLKEKYLKEHEENNWEKKLEETKIQVERGECNLIEANFSCVEFVLDQISDGSPKVIYGLIPPFYPSVTNQKRPNLSDKEKGAGEKAAKRMHDTLEKYFKGISDLSYAGLVNGNRLHEMLTKTMPFYGSLYQLPVAAMEQISMPCLNLGPLGKDLHQYSERVWKEDLYYNLPKQIAQTIEDFLK